MNSILFFFACCCCCCCCCRGCCCLLLLLAVVVDVAVVAVGCIGFVFVGAGIASPAASGWVSSFAAVHTLLHHRYRNRPTSFQPRGASFHTMLLLLLLLLVLLLLLLILLQQCYHCCYYCSCYSYCCYFCCYHYYYCYCYCCVRCWRLILFIFSMLYVVTVLERVRDPIALSKGNGAQRTLSPFSTAAINTSRVLYIG